VANIGEKIKKLRRLWGWTQEQLAKKAGLHRVSVAQIEAGMRIPDLSTRSKLAKALGVKMTKLLEEETTMEMAKELSPAHEKWNSQVEEKVNLVRENDDKGTRQVDTWLERIENDKKNYAWNDQVSAGRARHYLALAKHFPDLSKHYQELAILEIYSLQYATPEEKRLWRESMDIVE